MYGCKHRKLGAIVVFTAAIVVLGGCGLSNKNLTTIGSTAASTATTIHDNNKDDLARARRFAKNRKVALRRDAARGDGEVVEAFAVLLHERNPREFGAWMQGHYAQLYSDTPDQSDLVARVIALR